MNKSVKLNLKKEREEPRENIKVLMKGIERFLEKGRIIPAAGRVNYFSKSLEEDLIDAVHELNVKNTEEFSILKGVLKDREDSFIKESLDEAEKLIKFQGKLEEVLFILKERKAEGREAIEKAFDECLRNEVKLLKMVRDNSEGHEDELNERIDAYEALLEA